MPHLYALLRQIFHLEAFGTVIKQTKRTFGTANYHKGAPHSDQQQYEIRKHYENAPSLSESTDGFVQRSGVPLTIIQQREYSVHSIDASDKYWTGTQTSVRSGGDVLEVEKNRHNLPGQAV